MTEQEIREEMVAVMRKITSLEERYRISFEKFEIFEVRKGLRVKIRELNSRLDQLEMLLVRLRGPGPGSL